MLKGLNSDQTEFRQPFDTVFRYISDTFIFIKPVLVIEMFSFVLDGDNYVSMVLSAHSVLCSKQEVYCGQTQITCMYTIL